MNILVFNYTGKMSPRYDGLDSISLYVKNSSGELTKSVFVSHFRRDESES